MNHPSQADSRQTQRGRILALLVTARGGWVALPALGVAQYNSRVLELRRLGFRIENRREAKRSWFRLVAGPSLPTPAPAPVFPPASTPDTESLFGDISPDRTYEE
jgi:hypothetical protein